MLNIQELFEDREIWLFGAGLGGRIAKTIIQDFLGRPIAGFLDNRELSDFCLLPVIRPDRMAPGIAGRALVINTAQRFGEVQAQLSSLGFISVINAWPALSHIIEDIVASNPNASPFNGQDDRMRSLIRNTFHEVMTTENGLLDRVEERVDRSLVSHVPHMLARNFDYMRWHAQSAVRYHDWMDHMRYAIGAVELDGLHLEFGVLAGRTINFIASHIVPRIIHGFDSFLGLPETWYGNAAGYLSQSGRLPQVHSNVQLHAGWFKDTLGPFLAENAGPIAFAHIDCDVYSSTAEIFEHTGDRFVTGSIIVFDEYWGYEGWREHEYKAFQEFCRKRKVAYEYLSCAVQGGSVAVRIVSVG
ncbi:TylF/MycF/NovP-related O-methyltransferase [Azospirillum brasilense]|uniref:Class I SAM-dependent methyltransferase n=1 Tax=Azospirillum brasilense TaxID=192 RepID=A0A6L3AS46_AZOBR|nr:class I SAM-dependent methyltransferase [Azospirillum brasilense]KAA0677914.1 class I SAM-dependent methyltransferase [Azospirillum brasilense]